MRNGGNGSIQSGLNCAREVPAMMKIAANALANMTRTIRGLALAARHEPPSSVECMNAADGDGSCAKVGLTAATTPINRPSDNSFLTTHLIHNAFQSVDPFLELQINCERTQKAYPCSGNEESVVIDVIADGVISTPNS